MPRECKGDCWRQRTAKRDWLGGADRGDDLIYLAPWSHQNAGLIKGEQKVVKIMNSDCGFHLILPGFPPVSP
eukprot:scaffold241317_cov17-Tisochrysis_lutea.AAC.1